MILSPDALPRHDARRHHRPCLDRAVQPRTQPYGRVAAVRDVSIEVARAEIRGLIGPNGSGKTTLLNLIGGQETPDRGDIRLGAACRRGE